MAVRVLYVEDNLDNMILVRRILRAAGFELFEAASASVGIALAQEILPDIILMDINMPDMDGLTAVKHLRELPALDATPIVAVTANVMHNILQRALNSGCDGYIEKPVHVDDFPDQIMSFIEQRHKK